MEEHMERYKPSLFADDFIFLEAPRWHDNRLWVSDVFDHTVYTLDPNGTRQKICEVPQRPSGLGFLPDGTPIVVSSKDRRLMKIVGHSLIEYSDLSAMATGDVNDFAVDGQGRIYVGNFGYDYDAGEPRALTSLHRVDRDGAIRVAATGLEFPNGSVIIEDGKTLIVAETWLGRLTAFDIDSEGELGNRRLYADLGTREPDGICADGAGAIWVACFNTGEFLRVLEGGAITDIIKFDGRAISCAVGGAEGCQLFLQRVSRHVRRIVGAQAKRRHSDC
ncbi:SMP-30/gluconolactonase/LRE family protein [Cupriavidus basilensis]